MSDSDTDLFRGDGPPRGLSPGDNPDFPDLMDEIEVSGASFIVSGLVGCEHSQALMQDVFGTADRKQVLALSNDHHGNPDAWLPCGVNTDSVGVRTIRRAEPTRSTATASPNARPDSDGETDIATFREDILDAVLDLNHNYRLGAGDLRVSVDSLGALLDDATHGEVEMFVRVLSTHVRTFGGRIFFHFRRRSDSDAVAPFEDLVDGHIKLRESHDQQDKPEQRWCFPAWNVASDWVDLPSYDPEEK